MLQNEPTTSLFNNQWSSRFINFVVYNWLPNQMSGDEWNQTCSMSNDIYPPQKMLNKTCKSQQRPMSMNIKSYQ